MNDEQVHGHWDKEQQRYEDGEKSHRCVHAVDGPDWAGLRELNNADVDYKALVEHSRQLANFDDLLETKGVSNTLGSLADAIEALVAENEKLRADRDTLVRRLVGPWTVVPEGEGQ